MRIRSLTRQERWAVALTTAAVLWAAALVVVALLVPLDDGWTAQTLVQANGTGILVPISVPVGVASLVWLILSRRCSRGMSDAPAWALICVLALFSVVSGMSIGMFVIPVPLLLAFGTSLTPDGRSALTPG